MVRSLRREALLVLCGLTALGAAAGAAEITVDCGARHQTIEGFGTAIYLYSNAPLYLYPKPEFRKLYVEDLGASMVRAELHPSVLPEEVEDWREISYKNFVLAGDARRQRLVRGNLEFVAGIARLNPQVKFTPSVWSPPGWMKTNGQPTRGGNLRKDRYMHYAKYLAEWCLLMKEQYGVPIYAIGVQNEPYFFEPYNSCIYKNGADYAEMVKTVGRMFEQMKIETKIFGPEDMTKFPERVMKYYIKPVMDDAEARRYLHIFATHGYSDGIESAGGIKDNNRLWQMIQQHGRPLWMTETGAGWTDWEAVERTRTTGRRKGQKYNVPGALDGIGYMMHSSLVYGNISAWLLWQIAVKDGAGEHGLVIMKETGRDITPILTKKYFVARHYYRFIRPGAVRVGAGPDGEGDVFVSAFVHDRKGTLAVILINRGEADRDVTLTLKDGPPVDAFETYRTTQKDDANCTPVADTKVVAGKVAVRLPARSITTLYSGKGADIPAPR